MRDPDERRRILDLLEGGQISTGQATELLRALEPVEPSVAAGPTQGQRRFGVRMIRISIDATKPDGSRSNTVRVNVPLALARFATRFIPPDARAELDANEIDLSNLVTALNEDLPDGVLMDLTSTDEESGKSAKIRIEIV